jgi:5'(3')-deoxyribonucleotidase
MNRVFVDMDGVIVDFHGYMTQKGLSGDAVKCMPGAYLEMQPLPGGLEAVRSLIGMGFDVWIATKPPTGITFAYADKAAWVLQYLPELKRKIIITHDKGLLGDADDYLIDDRPHKANCENFKGVIFRFQPNYFRLEQFDSQKMWTDVLNTMRFYRNAER